MFLAIFCILLSLSLADDNCNLEKKIYIGDSSVSKNDCVKYIGCWDSVKSLCFYGKDYVPGFARMKGFRAHNGYVEETLNRENCSEKCLKYNDCDCFTHDKSSNQCKIFRNGCNIFQDTSLDLMLYQRTAKEDLTCYHSTCPSPPSNVEQAYSSGTFRQCKINCGTDPCDFFSFNFKIPANNCERKTKLCNFLDIQNKKHFEKYSCIPGPVFSDDNYINSPRLHNITNGAMSLCVDVKLASPFTLRLPWPNLGDSEKDFIIKIHGHNLKKCIRNNDLQTNSGVLAYLPTEFHIDPIFNSVFQSCEFRQGNDNTECHYYCTCHGRYCQAVYIKAFAVDTDNMKICEYELDGGA